MEFAPLSDVARGKDLYLCSIHTSIHKDRWWSAAYYKNHLLHRIGKPAVIIQSVELNFARFEFWEDNLRHRENGPALYYEQENGLEEYYIRGVRYSKVQWFRPGEQRP